MTGPSAAPGAGPGPGVTIAVDDPGRPDVVALLDTHLAFSYAVTPPEHVFALDAGRLGAADVTFFSARLADGTLVAMAALRHLDDEHAELKSMHTAAAARRRGVGRAMVEHLLAHARARGYRRVSLETGTMEAYAPARALYRHLGFSPCEPFAEYVASSDNTWMTLHLDGEEPGTRQR